MGCEGLNRSRWTSVSDYYFFFPVYLLKSVLSIFGFTKGLSVLLQESRMDITTAHKKTNIVLGKIRIVRRNAEEEFSHVFKAATEVAEKTGHFIKMPRRCKKQTLRSNMEVENVLEYYRRSVFPPFVDNMTEHLASRFPQLAVHACRGLLLIPANLGNFTDDHVYELHQYYQQDLSSPAYLEQEFKLWKAQWQDVPDVPTSLESTLKH